VKVIDSTALGCFRKSAVRRKAVWHVCNLTEFSQNEPLTDRSTRNSITLNEVPGDRVVKNQSHPLESDIATPIIPKATRTLPRGCHANALSCG
jgi:hypothetical protein